MKFNYKRLNKAVDEIVINENNKQYKLLRTNLHKADEGRNYLLHPPINTSTAKYFYQNNAILYKCIRALMEDIVLGEMSSDNNELLNFWKNNQDELGYLCIDYLLFGFACGEILKNNKGKVIAIKQAPADTVKLIEENGSIYVQQWINGNSSTLTVHGEIYDENKMRKDIKGNCIWIGGDERFKHFSLPRWYPARNQLATNILINDLNIDNIQNGNLMSGILVVNGGRQLPFNDGTTFEDHLKKQFNNVGTGLAVSYIENGNRDSPLNMQYINLTNNNSESIKKIYEDNEQDVLECFFMPKIRLLNNEGKESMNSNKSEILWGIYLRSCANIQKDFLSFLNSFNSFFFNTKSELNIALPTFEDNTKAVIENVEKLMNMGLMNQEQAIEYINKNNSDFNLVFDENYMNKSYSIGALDDTTLQQ